MQQDTDSPLGRSSPQPSNWIKQSDGVRAASVALDGWCSWCRRRCCRLQPLVAGDSAPVRLREQMALHHRLELGQLQLSLPGLCIVSSWHLHIGVASVLLDKLVHMGLRKRCPVSMGLSCGSCSSGRLASASYSAGTAQASHLCCLCLPDLCTPTARCSVALLDASCLLQAHTDAVASPCTSRGLVRLVCYKRTQAQLVLTWFSGEMAIYAACPHLALGLAQQPAPLGRPETYGALHAPADAAVRQARLVQP